MSRQVHIIIGTKAQLIKMAPIMIELQKKDLDYNFIFTGQHKETIENLIDNFNIKYPDIILYSGKEITGVWQMFSWFIKTFIKSLLGRKKIFGQINKNDIVLVHGDTASTFLGALLGKTLGLKVGHIESGLRSFDIFNPFPEELTRILTFYLTDYYFCPDEKAIDNLKKFNGHKINTQANTLYDSLNLTQEDPKPADNNFCLFTIHRFENIFNFKQLKKIIRIANIISKKIKIIFIMHPPTQKQLDKYNLTNVLKNNVNIVISPRLDYFAFIKLLKNSKFLLTDGGSNQEECYYLGKPCLLLRKSTERQEGLGGNVVISNYNSSTILDFVDNYEQYKKEKIIKNISPSAIIIKRLMQDD